MARKALLFILLLSALNTLAQMPVSATFGAGYRTPFGTLGAFVMGMDLTDRIHYQIGPALNISHNGIGGTTGFKWTLLKQRKFTVTFNADYQMLFSRNISKLFDSDRRHATYRTPLMHHVYAGTSFNILMNRVSKSLGEDKFSINACYGFGLGNYRARLVGGETYAETEKNINRQIASGIGFSLSYTAYLFQ